MSTRPGSNSSYGVGGPSREEASRRSRRIAGALGGGERRIVAEVEENVASQRSVLVDHQGLDPKVEVRLPRPGGP